MFSYIYKSLIIAVLGIIHPDETLLDHVQQLTRPDMGFERAGEAYFSPDGQMISFQAVPKGHSGYQIYTLDLKSKELRQISQNALTCTCSFFRPDGKKLIFAASPAHIITETSNRYKWDLTPYMNIYEANIDGSDPVALTHGPAYHAECAYSPDGSEIVYASNEDGSMNIYVMNRDGSNVRQVTHTTHCYNGGPFFSPDGKKIVFRADRNIPDRLQIYMIDKDGSNLVQLTDNEAINWAPFWHPSQDVIAYTTSIHGHSNYEIYLLSISTGRHYRVTHHPAFDGLPTFNREGTKLLWTSRRGSDNTPQVFMADFSLPADWISNSFLGEHE